LSSKSIKVRLQLYEPKEVKDLVKGKVKRWLGLKGYGFIDSEEHDEDIFVHASDIQGKDFLSEGEEVEFEVISTYKGPKSVKVKPVSE
jgi:CspA family cold shock protein